jgi:hypothetical protein
VNDIERFRSSLWRCGVESSITGLENKGEGENRWETGEQMRRRRQ